MPLPTPMLERRERILAAAREIVGSRGFDALTMRDLARAASVTVPTIYNLIGSKDEVLFEAVEETTTSFVVGLEDTRGKDPAERCVAVAEACVRELLRLPRYYRSLLLLLITSQAAEKVRARVTVALFDGFAEALADMEDSGALLDWVDVRTLAGQLTLQLNMTALVWATGGMDDAALRAAAPFGTSLLLLGVCDAATRPELERRTRSLQRKAALPAERRPRERSVDR